MRIFYLIGLTALALPVQAGEFAVLANGFRIHADRHEVDGGMVRLFADGGITEMPAQSVVQFEVDEIAAAPVPAQIVDKPDRTYPANGDWPSLSREDVPRTPVELAASAARKYSLPESFVQSVMRAESGFQSSALSPKGAIGLMQLMPDTARALGVDPQNPKENAEGGAQYLHDLLAKYQKNPDQVLLALAAYNAGPAAVERYHGVPPYRETREYIVRVLKNWDRSELHK
jgi:soluble lytic murein transglycosylase-like protein